MGSHAVVAYRIGSNEIALLIVYLNGNGIPMVPHIFTGAKTDGVGNRCTGRRCKAICVVCHVPLVNLLIALGLFINPLAFLRLI